MLAGLIPVSPFRGHRHHARPRPAALTVGLLALAVAGVNAPAAVAQPTMNPPQQIVGPQAGVISLGGLVVARDGTGGIVYLANSGSGPHVFVSRLIGGAFQPPQQVDPGLSGNSSQPVITGTNNGVLAVAFINSGNLYVSEAASGSVAFSAPLGLASGASNPTIQMDPFGEAYLAFTAAVLGGNDVEVEYYNTESWAPASPLALNGSPDDAGTGAGAPVVATSGDGVAIVVWGEGGHVYARRVWGTMTSIQTEQLDPSSVAGAGEISADSPQVSVGGDSSYPGFVFREQVSGSGRTPLRVVMRRLTAETIGSPATVDGLPASGSAGATDPGIAMNEYGRGFATAETIGTDQVFATPLGTDGAPGAPSRVDSGTNLAPPDPVPAPAGLISTLIAWQQTQVPSGATIVVRYAQDGVDLGPLQTASSTAQGPTEADAGLAAGGDSNGDAAVAWVQGIRGQFTIDAAQLYQAPGAPTPTTSLFQYSKTPQPALSWTPARESWGPVTYTVTLDGQAIGQTTSTSFGLPNPLVDGPHTWTVAATNPSALTSTSSRTTLFVDTQPPVMRIRITGRARVGATVATLLAYLDPPNPAEPGAQASGIASVNVSFGRRSPVVSATGLTIVRHVFTRPGLYPVTVTAIDKAGNATTISRWLRIRPLPQQPTAAPKSTTTPTTAR